MADEKIEAEQDAARPSASTRSTFYERGKRFEDEIDPYVPGLTRNAAARLVGVKGSDIAKLSSNENPLGPPAAAVDAVRRTQSVLHEYPDPTAQDLRVAIGEYLDVHADQVVVGAGSSTLMHAIVDAFTTPGGEIVSLDPSFTVYSEISVSHDRRPVHVRLRAHDYLLDLARLREALSERTQLVFLTRPNNPTSTLIPLADLVEAARMAEELGALVVSDEAYIEFADSPDESAIKLLQGAEDGPSNVLTTRTFSKAFGLANLRLGYAVGSPEIAHLLSLANAKWPTGEAAQAAGCAALGDREHLRRTIEMVRDGRRALVAGFEDLGMPVAPNPQGNYVMVDVSSSGISAQAFSEEILRRSHVLIRGDFSPRYARVSVGLPEQNERVLHGARAIIGERRG